MSDHLLAFFFGLMIRASNIDLIHYLIANHGSIYKYNISFVIHRFSSSVFLKDMAFTVAELNRVDKHIHPISKATWEELYKHAVEDMQIDKANALYMYLQF
jgi:hypothetical protein